MLPNPVIMRFRNRQNPFYFFLIFLNSMISIIFIEMSENEETSSSERVNGDEYVLKKANQANLKEEEEKSTSVKVDVKEDATSEE